jgi:hypothetical protein
MDSLRPLLFALHDGVMLLAPRGWSVLDGKFEGGRLLELAAQGEGAQAPKPKPDLGVDLRAEAQRVSEALADVATELNARGKQWSGGVVRLKRAVTTDVTLLRPDGSTAYLARLERSELDELLMTDALFDAIEGTERAFRLLQSAMEAKGAPLQPGVELGRYHSKDFAWEWNHHHPDVRRLCAVEVRPPGLSAFSRPSFFCDEGFAWALCGHLVVALGAQGLGRVPVPGGAALHAIARS